MISNLFHFIIGSSIIAQCVQAQLSMDEVLDTYWRETDLSYWNINLLTQSSNGFVLAPNGLKPYTGIVYELDKKGRLILDGEFVNGLKEGIWTYFKWHYDEGWLYDKILYRYGGNIEQEKTDKYYYLFDQKDLPITHAKTLQKWILSVEPGFPVQIINKYLLLSRKEKESFDWYQYRSK